jgi:hypothetical protein
MKNKNTRLILLYLVFMLGMRANAQKLSIQDSLKYAKELELDFSAKRSFIEKNSKRDYERLVSDLMINAKKYDDIYDNLQKLTRALASEKTGDANLIDHWGSVCPDTVTRPCTIFIDLDVYNTINSFMNRLSDSESARQKNINRIINFRYIEFLKNNPGQNPLVKPEDKKRGLFKSKSTKSR